MTKQDFYIEIENLPPFKSSNPNHQRVWVHWEKLVGDGKLREIDLMRLKSLLEAVYESVPNDGE